MIKEKRKYNITPKEDRTGKAYTEAELTYLEGAWGTVPIRKIAGCLHRSVEAVEAKARKMKLGNPLDCKDFLIAVEVAELLGVDRKTLNKHLTQRGLEHKIKSLKNRKLITVKYEDLIDWLMDNTQYWNGTKVDKLGLISIGLDEKFLEKKVIEDTKKEERTTLTDRDREKIKKLYKEFITYEGIALKLNKEYSTVKWCIHTMISNGEIERNTDSNRLVRVTNRANYGWEKWQDRLLIEEFKNGKTLKEISEMVGKSISATKSRNQVLTRRIIKGLAI